MERRMEKLSSFLRREAAAYLETVDIPLGTVCTVTNVVLSEDKKYANIFISIFPALHIGSFLEKWKVWQREFEYQMRKKIRMRIIPAIRFKLDDTELKRERIEKLLEDAKE